MNIFSFMIIASIVLAVNKTWKRIIRWWHRKKFCEDNRGLCRALVTAGFPDFKEYLYFKEDSSPGYELWYKYGCIDFYGSELSKQDKEKILNVVEEYWYCTTDYDYGHNVVADIPIRPENYPSLRRIYLKEKKRGK
jgi:hypothetical protein